MIPAVVGLCSEPNCSRRAVSRAYSSDQGLRPVCRRHILAYRVYPTRAARDAGRHIWQAEDESADLRFARRSRWRWLAQRRILRDQRLARYGIESRAQRTRRERADAEGASR